METINRVVDEANRAIWGNNPDTSNTLASEEPVAGKQGKGTANEPYDLGNAEVQPGASSKQEAAEQPDAGSTSATSTSAPSNAPAPSNVPATSQGLGPSSAPKPEQKQQGADRPLDDPSPEQTSAIGDKKETAERGQDSPSLADRREGGADPSDTAGEPLGSAPQGDASGGAGAGGPGAVKPPADESHEEGTGEKYVKSTGLAAEGGDFDASRPGAGREADRILEAKGQNFHHDQDQDKESSSKASGSSGEGKTSKVQKIKEKLHIGKR